ncbi:MAG TPA: hypothetical protein VFL93_12295 [Longimicrobiaceae bacterium]|nr:hypothetical protein [Longimicrobiaceae bacterium]
MTGPYAQDRDGAAARLTPYELVFGAPEFEERLFPKIRDEAERNGADPLRFEEFNFLSGVGAAVRAVVPEGAPPEAAEQYRRMLYHAYNFWRAGELVYLLEPGVARYLVEAAPAMRDWEFTTARPALYVQLPANLFWGSISPESTPEPVDGFFVTTTPLGDAPGGAAQRVSVLVVLGIRRDRAGFSVIAIDTETGPGIAAEWAEAAGRQGGADFENVLPGGEISGLYSILTAGEVLKLMGRAVWYVDRFPGEVTPEPAPERRPEGALASPPRIPYHRVSLGQGEDA